MPRLPLACVVACAATLLACAHARPSPGAEALAPSWPAPPQQARARWVASFPGEAVPQQGWIRTAWNAFLGIDPALEAEPFARPFGLAGRGHELLVTDPDAKKVLRIDWRRGTSEEVTCRGRDWVAPLAAAIADERTAYVADGASIVKLRADGVCKAFGDGVLARASGVAVAQGLVYVVDPPSHRVVAFTDDGVEAFRFGVRGEGPGQLNYPTAIAAEPAGTLAVVDALNFRVARFGARGEPLGSFGEPGDTVGTFGRPKGVAAAGGRSFVSDADWDVVLVFSADGQFQYPVGQGGTGPGELVMPAGVAVSGEHLFVASSQTRRIEIYELLGGQP